MVSGHRVIIIGRTGILLQQVHSSIIQKETMSGVIEGLTHASRILELLNTMHDYGRPGLLP